MSGNFLEVGEGGDKSFENLLIEASDELKQLNLPLSSGDPEGICKTILPTPGFCIKTKDDEDGKVFLNVCHSPELPEPREIDEDLLVSILNSDDPTTYRIPMSLGECREDKDKGGQTCSVYDIVINSDYYKKVTNSKVFKQFLITVCLDGIEDKYHISVDKESYVILKNKKYHGSMPVHNIKLRPKTLVTEIEESRQNEDNTDISRQREVLLKEKIPSYIIKKEPIHDFPQKLLCEIDLPKVKNSTDLTLYIGEDRIMLIDKDDIYHLDLFLPYFVDPDQSRAKFFIQKKKLKIKIPVVSFMK
ncbi:PIH1 domain-containing protein 1-like [Centruroides vittatus]|uniref:PIH1 domain-containing protein 1-like n=1 Tax=Centruroides vittatus TaxID=120091 RepID=UPI003510CA2D